jgi:CRISPR system Cascade subunit CasA
LFARDETRAALGERSKAWVTRAADARLKILKPALLTLLQGGPEKLKFDDNRAEVYLRRLDAAIDEDFFPFLFEHADEAPELADAAFEKRLVDLAKVQLDDARGSLPVPSARRWRAEAYAYCVFFGTARKYFKLAYPTSAMNSSSGDSP